MAEQEYDCVDCGRSRVAPIWYVRQSKLIGPLLKANSVFRIRHDEPHQGLVRRPATMDRPVVYRFSGIPARGRARYLRAGVGEAR